MAVAGRNFKAGERVRLTAEGRRKTVTAGTRGGFKVVFPEANVCNGFAAVARGSEGSRASVTFGQFLNVHAWNALGGSSREAARRRPLSVGE